ncbi:amidase [Viridothelium virens]|uniref:amidase n=1 Tax=Viridothelium virens TaxID=1048519 RepID=A0A6A6HMY8_VIRVR|nr:amidase [Viridothelium virens]
MTSEIKDWKAVAKEKRDAITASIPSEWHISNIPSAADQRDVTGKFIQQYLNEKEVEITETDAVGIAKKTKTGQWKAVDVTKAFCHRAALAHQLVSCLHETFFDAAIKDAQILDDYYATHNRPVGPLHGIPISLKDQFHVKDVETTMGYVGWIGTFEGKKGTNKEKVFESEMVRELRNLGAVLYCKTSVPHTLMAGETANNIIGYTWNPKNRNLACGGSSGGEGALIGLRGSPLGFGTDIGGSIRIPAAFNGLFGLRPSSGRLPYEGMANSMDGQNSVLSVVGPLGTSIGGLRLATKALLSQQPWLHDPLVHEIPWRDDQEKEIIDLVGSMGHGHKLTFGVLKHDGTVTPHPPVRRAMDIVAKTMERLGHEVIEWQHPVPSERFTKVIGKIWTFDGGHDVANAFSLSGEQVAEAIVVNTSPTEQANASEIAATNVVKRDLQKEYLERWNSTKELTSTGRPIDAILSPAAPFAAARPSLYTYLGYSVWVNFFDYTSVVVPVTNVDKSVDQAIEGYQPLNDIDKKTYECYNAELYDGAPVSIQVVGRRLQEEKMLALAEYISNEIHKN